MISMHENPNHPHHPNYAVWRVTADLTQQLSARQRRKLRAYRSAGAYVVENGRTGKAVVVVPAQGGAQ